MSKFAAWILFAAGWSLSGCSSVAVPTERCYRLALPSVQAPDPGRAGILRVQDLQLGTALDADCVMRQDGVRMTPWPLVRWVAPLDRLVSDALVLGLSRARVCELVKGAGDPGAETWSLRGRIVEFAEAAADAGSGRQARVTLELWLEAADGRVLFHDEFAAAEPIAADDAAAAVEGLSAGLQQVTMALVQRMRAQDLFAAARAGATAAGETAATPGR
jgi:uncharacterized lipoprotein YmbA